MRLEQQSLLRVHGHRFDRRNPKKARIKLVDRIDKTAVPAHDLAWLVAMQRVDVPARGRHLSDRIHSLHQQLPERSRRVRPTWKTAGHTDHGNRLTVVGRLGTGRWRLPGQPTVRRFILALPGKIAGDRLHAVAAEKEAGVDRGSQPLAEQRPQLRQFQRAKPQLAQRALPVEPGCSILRHDLPHRLFDLPCKQSRIGGRTAAVRLPASSVQSSTQVVFDQHPLAQVGAVGGTVAVDDRANLGTVCDMKGQDRVDRQAVGAALVDVLLHRQCAVPVV